MTAPAGWYLDPHDSSQRRYWDGTSWTDRLVPADLPEPTIAFQAAEPPPTRIAPAPPTQTARVEGSKQWYQRPWVWAVAGVVVLVVVIGSVGGNANPKPAAEHQPTAPRTEVATPDPAPVATATVTVEATPTKAAADEEAATGSQVGNNPPASGNTFEMPNEVGKGLQAAQDDLQAVTGNPFFYTGSEDASGQDRFQMWDSNWQVCSQKPKPGTRLSLDYEDIVFYVVKTSESCP